METAKISIKEMKRRGLTAMRANFLLCVFTALLVALLVEGSTNMFSGTAALRMPQPDTISTEAGEDGNPQAFYSYTDESGETVTVSQEEMEEIYKNMQIISQVVMFIGGHMEACMGQILNMVFVKGAGIFGILFCFLISNVVEVGCCRFFIVNSKRKAYINEILSFFKKGKFRRAVMVQLYRVSYIFCWGLLLIVPGVIKAYEYRLVPYLLADGVEKTIDETLAMSKELMNGHKKEAFLLDLSFLGWDLLGVFTFGIVGTFFSNPFKYTTRTEFYSEIRRMNDSSYQGVSGGNASGARRGQDPFAGYRAYQKKEQK